MHPLPSTMSIALLVTSLACSKAPSERAEGTGGAGAHAPSTGGALGGGGTSAGGVTTSAGGATSGTAGAPAGEIPGFDVLFARSDYQMRGLLVDDDNIYFGVWPLDNSFHRIERIPKSGAAESKVVGDLGIGEMGIQLIVADSERVYWLDSGVSYQEKATGVRGHWNAVSAVAASGWADGIAADENYVYTVDLSCGGLSRFDKRTGEGVYVVGSSDPGGGGTSITQTTDAVYCGGNRGVFVWSKADLSLEKVVLPVKYPTTLAVMSDLLFIGLDNGDWNPDYLWQSGLHGEDARELGRIGTEPMGDIGSLIADPVRKQVYATRGDTQGIWMSRPGGPVNDIAPSLHVMGGLDQDADSLYVLASADPNVHGGTHLVRVPKPL